MFGNETRGLIELPESQGFIARPYSDFFPAKSRSMYPVLAIRRVSYIKTQALPASYQAPDEPTWHRQM
jgi:hypothetical protein